MTPPPFQQVGIVLLAALVIASSVALLALLFKRNHYSRLQDRDRVRDHRHHHHHDRYHRHTRADNTPSLKRPNKKYEDAFIVSIPTPLHVDAVGTRPPKPNRLPTLSPTKQKTKDQSPARARGRAQGVAPDNKHHAVKNNNDISYDASKLKVYHHDREEPPSPQQQYDIQAEIRKLQKQVFLSESQHSQTPTTPEITHAIVDVPNTPKKGPEVQRLETLFEEFSQAVATGRPTGANYPVVPSKAWGNLIAMGDIYRRGAFPRYRPNSLLAIECFRMAARCPHGRTAGTAQWKYIEARNDDLAKEDQAGAPLPDWFGRQACALAERAIANTPYTDFEKVSFAPATMTRPRIAATTATATTAPVATITPMGHTFTMRLPRPNREIQAFVMDAAGYVPGRRVQDAHMMDSQNVHDHSVVAITQRNLESLQKQADIEAAALEAEGRALPATTTSQQALEQVTQTILEDAEVSADSKIRALDTLQSISRSSAYKHSTVGVSESEALRLVWDRIQKLPDETLRSNLRNTLVQQLASAVESGSVVCSTGKISRILGTLDGVELCPPSDSDSSGVLLQEAVRPMWAVRDELATLASRIRDKHTPDNGAEVIDNDVSHLMHSEFREEALRIYRDELGMNETILEPIISAISEGFNV